MSAYTRERYERACEVFLRSPEPDVTEKFPSALLGYYDLRPRSTKANSKSVSCVDDDKSGDYKPDEESLSPKPKRRKSRPQNVGRINMTSVDGSCPPAKTESAPTKSIYDLVLDLGPGLPPVLVKKPGVGRPESTQFVLPGRTSGRSRLAGFRPISQSFGEGGTNHWPGPLSTSRRCDAFHPWIRSLPRDGPVYPVPFIVRTELPHPLTIMHDPSAPEWEPCHWCDNFAYGIAGLGVRYPEVVATSPGKWTERRLGHTQEGKEPSRMCIGCCHYRIGIILCSHEKLVPLAEDQNVELDEGPIFEQLTKASQALIFQPGSASETDESDETFGEPMHPWCSLCQAPAHWRCDQPQTQGRQQGREVIPVDTGCGLHLCEYCAYYTYEFRGDLDIVHNYGKQDPAKDLEFRADVHYILKKSKKNVFWQQVTNKKMPWHRSLPPEMTS